MTTKGTTMPTTTTNYTRLSGAELRALAPKDKAAHAEIMRRVLNKAARKGVAVPTEAPAPAKKAPAKKAANPKTVRANASGAKPGSTDWWNAYHGRTTTPAQGVARIGFDPAAEWDALPTALRVALLESTVSSRA
jgi:hypothetical protein